VLGSYGCVINDIQPDASAPGSLFSRFGRDLAHAWASHVTYNLEQLDGGDLLVAKGVLTRQRQKRLRDELREFAVVPMHFGLSHWRPDLKESHRVWLGPAGLDRLGIGILRSRPMDGPVDP